MTGSVHNRHALLAVTFRLVNQPDRSVDFIGFTGFLTLPLAAAVAMGLRFIHRIPIHLADDSRVEVAVYTAVILWNGAEQEVRVLATGARPLLGTSLLEGQELVAQFTEGGLVTVDDL